MKTKEAYDKSMLRLLMGHGSMPADDFSNICAHVAAQDKRIEELESYVAELQAEIQEWRDRG